MQTVRAKEIRQRINRLEGQIHDLDTAMVAHRKWSRPWMMRRKAKERLKADIATLKIMLETLEPGGDASA